MKLDSVAINSRASIEKEDLLVLLSILNTINPKSILEIGMHQGYSMEVWRKAFNPNVLVGIERGAVTPDSYSESSFLWNTDSHTVNRDTLGKTKYDFIFIDGDHSLEGVVQDFLMYAPYIRKGGIVVFHDVIYHADGTEEVDILWKELKVRHPYTEIKVGRNSTGIGLIWV